MDEIVASRVIDDQIDALRVASALNDALWVVLAELRSQLRALLAAPLLNRRAVEQLIREAQALIDEHYREIESTHLQVLQEYALLATVASAKSVQIAIAAHLSVRIGRTPNVTPLLLADTPSTHWWRRQHRALRNTFAYEIQHGFAQGHTNEQIVARIAGTLQESGALDVARRKLRQLVHTSVQTVANHAREATYEANRDVIRGLRWLATLDGRTCLFCAARDGLHYTMEHEPEGHDLPWSGGPGACHFGCRCVTTARLISLRELSINVDEMPASTRASQDGQVASTLTFEHWLGTKSETYQDEYFGPGRAQLWREQKLTLSELLDMRGRPLSLAKLRARIERIPTSG